jgi:hypothetical protein
MNVDAKIAEELGTALGAACWPTRHASRLRIEGLLEIELT